MPCSDARCTTRTQTVPTASVSSWSIAPLSTSLLRSLKQLDALHGAPTREFFFYRVTQAREVFPHFHSLFTAHAAPSVDEVVFRGAFSAHAPPSVNVWAERRP